MTSEAIDFGTPGGQLTVAPAQADPMFMLIDRAARDPNVDIDKMERLLQMQERMQAKNAEVEYDNALANAQQQMSAVRADANNSQTRSKYASYFTLDRAIRPIYTSTGFSLSFDTAEGAPDGCVRIVCKVAHRGGHRERHHIDMPSDGKGAKGGDVMTKTHAMGSAITYGKRYLLGMIFNVAVGNDDDGNAAGGYRNNAPRATEAAPDLQPDAPNDWVDDAVKDGLIPPGGDTRSMHEQTYVPVGKRPENIERTKKMVDTAIGTMSLSGQTVEHLDAFWTSYNNEKAFNWIKKHIPAEYDRLEKAYMDARDAAEERTG